MRLDFAEPFIQVAGIADLDEAFMLIDCGVNYMGFPLCLDYNKPDMDETDVRGVISKTRGRICPVLITYLDRAKDIADLCTYLGVSIVQIHGDIAISEISELKRIRPDLDIIKSLIVRDNNKNDLLNSLLFYDKVHDEVYDEVVNSYITDTYDSQTGASGATGKVHDWEISRQIVAESSRPVILAGGLAPENVRDAILKVRPAGVDVHSGVEDELGRKSSRLVRRFVDAALAGFSYIAENIYIANNIAEKEKIRRQAWTGS